MIVEGYIAFNVDDDRAEVLRSRIRTFFMQLIVEHDYDAKEWRVK